MRLFDDHLGRRWQAATAFGSYGEIRLVFTRVDENELRTSSLEAANMREGQNALEGLTEEALRECLESAEPWQG